MAKKTYRCSVCKSPEHNRQNCPRARLVKPRPTKPRVCEVCEGMPHRRDVARYRQSDMTLSFVVPTDPAAKCCYGCGEPYQPEAPMTLAQAMAMPSDGFRAEPAAV